MINSHTLDLVIGLAVVYLTLALTCSGVNELIAGLLDLRAKALRAALEQLLGSQLARSVIDHPAVPAADTDRGGQKLPSYIEPALFAAALIDAVAPGAAPAVPAPAAGPGVAPAPNAALVNVATAINAAGGLVAANPPLGNSLNALIKSANGDYDKFVNCVGCWFDAYMDRFTGAYKRRAHLIILAISAVVVILLNVDTLRIYQQLSAQPAYASAVAARANFLIKRNALTQYAPTNKPQLGTLVDSLNSDIAQMPIPLGWGGWHLASPVNAWLLKIAGLFLSVVAGAMGAPFWFDTLNKLANLRSVGAKPD